MKKLKGILINIAFFTTIINIMVGSVPLAIIAVSLLFISGVIEITDFF